MTGRAANLVPPGLAGIRGDVWGADRLMTIGELAEHLQVPRETIYRWRKRGGGPCGFRMAGNVCFRRSDVEAWLEGGAIPPRSRRGAISGSGADRGWYPPAR